MYCYGGGSRAPRPSHEPAPGTHCVKKDICEDDLIVNMIYLKISVQQIFSYEYLQRKVVHNYYVPFYDQCRYRHTSWYAGKLGCLMARGA